MKLTIVIVLALLFPSCISESNKLATSKVIEFIKAEKVTNVNGVEIGTDKEELNYLGLTMSGGEHLDTDKIPDEYLSSMAAFIYFKGLSKEDFEGKNSIQIKLKRNIGNAHREVKATYKLTDLKIIDIKNQLLIESCKMMMHQNYQYIFDLLDDLVKNKIVDFNTLNSGFEKMDTKYGKIKDFHLNAFKLDKIQELSSENKEVIYLTYTFEREHHKSGATFCLRKSGEKLNILSIEM